MDKDYVLEKLEKKKELDPDFIGFGVEDHRYELLPPIEEDKLIKLEKKFEITLPDDYRNFILTIGNGGAGPSYGLYSIEGSLTGKDPTYPYPGRKMGNKLKQDFIRPDELAEDEYNDELGMIKICQHGCANDDFLIINGSERSYVWELIEWVGHHVPLLKQMPDLTYINDLPQSEKPAAKTDWINKLMSAKDEEKMTFSDWYKDWLKKPPHILPHAKKSLRKKKIRSWFSFK